MAYPAKKEGKCTYSDYLKTPDDKRFQLIEGELLMTPAPTTKHQAISKNLVVTLSKFLDEQKKGSLFYAPTDVVLDQFNVVQPDILFILEENRGIITKKNIQGAPDLVIEIISDSTASLDLIKKKELYGEFGAKEYWVVSPEYATLEIFALEDKVLKSYKIFHKKDIPTSPLLKGLSLKLTDIFSS